MVVWFSLSVGAFFQFPLIVVILVYIGVLATGNSSAYGVEFSSAHDFLP